MPKKIFFIILVIFFTSVVVTYLLGDYKSLLVHFWNLTPSLLAAGCGIATAKIYGFKNPHAKSLIFMSIGLFFWFVGDFIWFILEYFLEENPFPSIADFFYLAAYPFLLIGLIQEIRNNKTDWNWGKVLIGVFVSIVFGLIVAYFGILKAYDPLESLFNNVIAISYGVGDFILIIFAVAILMITVGYRKGKLFRPWLYVLTGFSLNLTADILFAMYTEEYENFVEPFRNIDLAWILGFLFISFGFFSMGETLKEAERKLLKYRAFG